MVDDTLAISECGVRSVEKNEVKNSFMETHRLKIHKEKSVVIHVSKTKKFSTPCPELKVHMDTMHKAEKQIFGQLLIINRWSQGNNSG